MEPTSNLRGLVLNNLAVASWWHKHPNFRDEEEYSSEEEDGPIRTSTLDMEDEEYSFK